jgi:heme-degrading monooxygenase HmoA
MIRHLVMWTLKEHADGADREANARRVRDALEACRGAVPGMGAFEVGLAQPGLEASHDVALVAEFESREALAAYQSHPAHLAVKELLGRVRESRVVMDYEV